MVFIPYKYVYNVNITDIEKPTQSFYAYSHSMILYIIVFNPKKSKFYIFKSLFNVAIKMRELSKTFNLKTDCSE